MGPEAPSLETALAEGLARELPGFVALRSCERLSGGASQETYRLVVQSADGERPLAMRRSAGGVHAPRMPGHPGLDTEALLFACARAAGVPEPEVYWVFGPEDRLGDGFVMEWLDGETLGARIARSEDLAGVRPRLARQCGEILARIHAIDVAAAGLSERLDRMLPHEYVEQTWARYRAFETPQPMIDWTGRWLMDHLPPSCEPRLVHNDFRNGNLMISPDGVVAVLDWELAHLGDPMRDLGWICTNSWRFGRSELPVGGFGAYEDLFAGYESVSGEKVDRARVRFWEVFGSFWWAVGCLEMAEHFRSGPDKTVERPAIGRRSSECQVDCVNLLIPGPVEPLAAPDRESSLDMPRADELLSSVRDYLREDVMAQTRGRTQFMARVAANSLDIVRRELQLGPLARSRREQGLRRLLASDADLESLEWRLVESLRDGSLALDHPGLTDWLRQSVVDQIAIDQPRYSGYAKALANPGG